MNLEKVVRRGLGLVLVLAALSVAVTTGAAATTQAKNPYSQLLRKADRQDSVRVIVEMSSLDEQGSVIRRARAAGAEVDVRYRLFPLAALTVNRQALVALAASPNVVHIQENAPERTRWTRRCR